MITECRACLVTALKQAGINTPIITTHKQLEKFSNPHVGSVLFESDQFSWDGAKRVYRGEDNSQYKRRKMLARETVFNVIIGDPNPTQCETIFEAFLVGLGAGLDIAGNYTAIEIVEAEWVDDDDSILKSKIAVNVRVKFIGGVFKDVKLGRLSSMDISTKREE